MVSENIDIKWDIKILTNDPTEQEWTELSAQGWEYIDKSKIDGSNAWIFRRSKNYKRFRGE